MLRFVFVKQPAMMSHNDYVEAVFPFYSECGRTPLDAKEPRGGGRKNMVTMAAGGDGGRIQLPPAPV